MNGLRIGLFGAKWVGELVNPSKRVAGGLAYLDVVAWGDTVTLIIQKSKTDQMGQGTKVELGRVLGRSLCPISVVRDWLQV